MKCLQLNKTENGHGCVDVCIFDIIKQWIKNIYYIYREKERFFYSINVSPSSFDLKKKWVKKWKLVLDYILLKENITNLLHRREHKKSSN